MASIKMCDNPDLASKSNSMIISAMDTYVCTDIGITIYFYQVYSCKYSSIVNKKRKKKQAKSCRGTRRIPCILFRFSYIFYLFY
jgi:hypothetical protein